MKIDGINGKNYSTKKSLKNNMDSKTSNPVTKANSSNVYFQTANSLANTNRGIINSKKDISFKGLSWYTDNYETNSYAIPDDAKEISTHDITIRGARDFFRVTATSKAGSDAKAALRDWTGFMFDLDAMFPSASGKINMYDSSKISFAKADFYIALHDNAEVHSIEKAQSVSLSGNSKANCITNVGSLEMRDNSKAEGFVSLKRLSDLRIVNPGKNLYINPFTIHLKDETLIPNNIMYTASDSSKHLYMPETVYFQDDYTFIKDYTAKDVESKSNVNFIDKSQARSVFTSENVNMQNNSFVDSIKAKSIEIGGTARFLQALISDSAIVKNDAIVGTIQGGHNIGLTDSASAIKIENAGTVLLAKNAQVDSIQSKNVSLNERSNVKIIDASERVDVLGGSKVKKIKSGSIVTVEDEALVGSIEADVVLAKGTAKIEQIYSDSNLRIQVKDNSSVDNITSKNNIKISGEGIVKNIASEGNQVLIYGPVQLKGKIKFQNFGEIIIQKDNHGEYTHISPEQVENGIIKYNLKTKDGDSFINHKALFAESLATTTASINELADKRLYGETLAPMIENMIDKFTKISPKRADINKMANMYEDFGLSTFVNLVESKNSKKYTEFWVKNKKIGNKNLTDFWLQSLHIDIKAKTVVEKTEILNSLNSNQKQQLIKNSLVYWQDKVLPKQLDKANKNDIKYAQLDKEGIDAIEKIKNDRKEELLQNINKDGIEKFESIQIGSKSMLNFWIDTIDGEGAANELNPRLKEKRLKEIIDTDGAVEKIYEETLEESAKLSTQVKRTQEAYSDLIEESELSESQKQILEEYQNNQLFFQVVNRSAKNNSSVTNLEITTKNILSTLSREKESVILNTRNNIFNKVKDFKYLSENEDETVLQWQIPFVFSILQDKIKNSTQEDLQTTKNNINKFDGLIKNNGDNMDEQWGKLVDEAQLYYENSILNTVTTKNIELLYSINTKLKGEKDIIILDAITNKALDKIEQKEYVSRYKDDKNLKIMLENSGVNKGEVIDELLYLEAINQQVFENESKEFRNNISEVKIKTNEDLANRYISALGKDYSPMSIPQKTEFLDSIAPEELELVAEKVYKKWAQNDLAKFMSEKFVETDHKNNINAQGKNIVNELKQINTTLGKMYIDINGQSHTLEEISTNFNKFSDMYQVNQDAQYNQLCEMAKQLASINKNTLNIESNTKALVRNVLKTADPLLRAEITSLLPEEDKVDVSKFLAKVDKLAKEEKDAKRRKQLLLIAAVVATVVTAGAIAYVAAPALLGAGAATATAGVGVTSSAAITAVNSAGMAQATGSSLLMKSAVGLISFGLSSSVRNKRDRLKSSGIEALKELASKITESTTEFDIERWVAAAGGWQGA